MTSKHQTRDVEMGRAHRSGADEIVETNVQKSQEFIDAMHPHGQVPLVLHSPSPGSSAMSPLPVESPSSVPPMRTTNDATSPCATTTVPSVRVPWHKRRIVRQIIVRVVMRLVIVAGLVVLGRYVRLDGLVDGYLDAVNEQNIYVAFFAFLLSAIVFSTLSPTGYLPTVLAGATFGLGIGVIISYVSVNAAGICNLFLVRRFLRPFAERVARRRIGEVSKINRLISGQEFKVVFVLRLPFLGSGMLNYLFSLSEVQPKAYFMANACGFVPGSVLFSALGSSARSLFKLATSGDVDAKAIVIICVQFVLVGCAIAGVVVLIKRMRRREGMIMSPTTSPAMSPAMSPVSSPVPDRSDSAPRAVAIDASINVNNDRGAMETARHYTDLALVPPATPTHQNSHLDSNAVAVVPAAHDPVLAFSERTPVDAIATVTHISDTGGNVSNGGVGNISPSKRAIPFDNQGAVQSPKRTLKLKPLPPRRANVNIPADTS